MPRESSPDTYAEQMQGLDSDRLDRQIELLREAIDDPEVDLDTEAGWDLVNRFTGAMIVRAEMTAEEMPSEQDDDQNGDGPISMARRVDGGVDFVTQSGEVVGTKHSPRPYETEASAGASELPGLNPATKYRKVIVGPPTPQEPVDKPVTSKRRVILDSSIPPQADPNQTSVPRAVDEQQRSKGSHQLPTPEPRISKN